MPTSISEETGSRRYLASEEAAITSTTHFFDGMKGKSRSQTSFKEVTSINRINSHFSRSEDESCGLYLLNFKDGGFALTSADQRDSAIVYIASPNLNISEEFLHTDDFMNYMISLIESYQDSVIATYNPEHQLSRSNNPEDRGGSLVETTTVNYDIGPLLTTAWSQGDPFNATIYDPFSKNNNNYNPNMGCVPVAIGQIMAFHQKPASLHGTPLNWSIIKSVTSFTSVYSAAAKDVSLFIKYVGEDLGIDYSTKERGITTSKEAIVLKSYGYTYDHDTDFHHYSTVNSIKNNRPVYMAGYDAINKSGHAWVVDGAYSYTVETLAFDENGNHIPNDYVFDYNTLYTYTYIHVNPGWGPSYLYSGKLTTYFDPMSDMPSTLYINSSIFSMDNKNYNSYQIAYYNIQ